MPAIELEQRLESLRRILLQAGQIATQLHDQGMAIARKADGTQVTDADIQVDALLRRELTQLVPEAGWLSEESEADPSRLAREWVWILDPLDGTKEFMRGIPEFAVSVALVRDGEPVLGGILNPATGEGGVGGAGGPVTFWGIAEAEGAPRTLDGAMACVSRSEIEDGSIAPFLGLVGKTRPVGSVAYKLLRVAAGLEDLTFSVQPKSEWDICGGVVLLHATGKTYRRLDGEPVVFNQPATRIQSGAVAGSAALVDAFVEAYMQIPRTQS